MTKLLFSDVQLIEATRRSVSLEAAATTNVVRHFKEIFERELHLARGYSSIFKMAVDEFGYDRSSAQRRINAMELSIAVPWVLTAIDQKRLSLQAAADIQTFLNKERGLKRAYTLEQKIELVRECLDSSSRAVQKKLACLNPNLDFTESKKFVSEDRIQVTHTINVAIEEKLERIKSLLSHVNPYMNREELLDAVAEIALDKLDPLRKAARVEKRSTGTVAQPETKQKFALTNNGRTRDDSTNDQRISDVETSLRAIFTEEVVSEVGEIQLAVDFGLKRPRYINASADRMVRRFNDERGCEFVDGVSGRRCGSHHQLQRDHVTSFADGGSNGAENLQMLCAQHNRFKFRRASS